ncbi:alkaline phosphatase family protein [Mariniblastus fucicola]|uniref:Type I phosphodiesterase / nucleotide pyrophosphatase n=1 Tax=Mariniblastus fucicola TaxID=980251 RepID=A0A5B9P376_9BACT|nr:alkaline phosphatase family protein [Mariniblastus fucicola]QEG20838.1 Type I phosphodiesterase / nucleotide pyrophosphatase [Mariniblastus fucicola]
MAEAKKKVLLIGWDGADWEHINPLMDEGLLPTLEGLVNEGTMANLATLQPVLSPMLWNSVATCKFADKHGIHGFVEPDENGGARPYSSVSRKTKALWNIFSQNGIRSNVINWWASHPAEKIDGCVVSNLFGGVRIDPESGWQITPGTVHPEEKESFYAQMKFFPNEIGQEHILPFIPLAAEIDQKKDKRLSSFAKTFAEMMTTHSVATGVMELEPWDFMAIYYTGIDHFSHGFMEYHPPKLPRISEKDFEIYKDVVKGAYQFHDMMLARILELADENTTIVLCSDHGFQSGAYRPRGTPREPAGPAVWHRQYGILVMKGPGIKKDERIYGASLIDVGPTLLQLYGLPVGDDMDGRVLIEAFEDPEETTTIPSWDDVPGNHGMPDKEEVVSNAKSEELLKQFVALGYVEDFGGDKEKQSLAADTEGKYNLSRCLMWQNRNDEAKTILEELLVLAPWENRFIIQLADCYFRCGYLKQAEALIDKAFDLEKTVVFQAIVIYAKLQFELGDVEKGMKYLTLASRRSPRFPKLHAQIGDAFSSLRNWKQAEKSYRKAIELHPDLAQAYQGLAKASLRMNRIDDAIDSALSAVGLVHRLPKAHLTLGIALARKKDFEKATLAFKNAAKFAPKMVHPHRWLVRIYEMHGEQALADQHRKQVALLSSFQVGERKTEDERRGTKFQLPEIEDEATREERLLKERPSPNDPVEESGKTFVLVSGLPRSGTSLMMQMLVAGGMEPISDGEREADTDNPKGYFEWEAIKQIGEKPELLDDDAHAGKVLKTISMLLDKMPRKHRYKVIFMMRPLSEIAASQTKMIQRLGTTGAEVEEKRLVRELARHRAESVSWLDKAQNVEHILVDYPALISDPESSLEKIVELLGDEYLSTPDQMISAIDKSLYRNRTEAKGGNKN